MHRTTYWAVVLLLFATHGCGETLDPEPGNGPPSETLPREDLGTSLTSVQAGGTGQWWWPVFAWAPDGTEILHFPFVRGPAGLQLLAVKTSDKSTRAVADIAHNSPGMVRVPRASATILYSAFTQTSPAIGNIYRVAPSGGAVETLLDGAATSFAVSLDGGQLAYTVPDDSLYLLNVNDGTTQGMVQDVTYVVGVSPDGTHVLHGSNPRRELLLSSVEDGSTLTVWLEEDFFERRLLGHRWEQGDVQLLFAQEDNLYLRESPTAPDRLLATLPGTVAKAGWSADGTRIVTWVSGTCLEQELFSCALQQYTLHLIDSGSGSVTQIGQGNFAVDDNERPGELLFSPDENRVAYVYHRSGPTRGSLLYVKDLP